MRNSLRERLGWCVCTSLVLTTLSCAESLAPALEIVLSEPSVDVRAVRGTTTPVTRTITVSNSGNGRLGPVSCPANPAPWLTCAVANGNAVTFTADPTGLATSPAPASVSITAPGAPDRPQSVVVNLIIDQPVLTLSASSVSFAASDGSNATTPPSATVTVTNTGAGTLANLGTIACVPTPANARVSCAVNQGTGVLTLSVDPVGLAPATYVYPVVVSAPNDNVAKTVAVTLAMSAVPRMVLSKDAVAFQAIRGGSAPAAQTVVVTNSGGGSLGTISCPASPAAWLSCAVSGGSTLTFTANPSGLTATPAAVVVPVAATGAANSPQSVTVGFTIRQPVLSVNTSTVNFAVAPSTGIVTPASATVTVTNTGEGTIADLGPIACAVPQGAPLLCAVDQAAGELTLSVVAAGVAAGTQFYSLAVSAPNSNATRVITVSIAPTSGIALSPKELNFQAIRGSTTDLVKTVTVTNAGVGSLGTVSCPANPATWLTCVVTNASTLTFTAKPAGLTASPLEVLVPVTASGLTTGSQNVTVNLAILQPVLSLNASVVDVTVAAGGTAALPAVMVTNTGAGVLADLGTISCVPSDARVSCTVTQGTGALSLTVNTATAPALAAGKYVYTVTVSAPNNTTSQTVTIVLTVT